MMPKKIVAFGEIMMRLKTPGVQRFRQAQSFEATYGGGEANVAVSLAQFGCDAVFVTSLPKNPLGDNVIQLLRGYGVLFWDRKRRERGWAFILWKRALTSVQDKSYMTVQGLLLLG